MALHKDLTGADLHEPKGIDTAGANRVYVSNGSGSGSWTSVPSLIAANPPSTIIGVGQTPRDLRSSRTHSTSYRNTTGKPIYVHIVADAYAATRWFQISSNGSSWVNWACIWEDGKDHVSISAIIPNNYYYRINGNTVIRSWSELR